MRYPPPPPDTDEWPKPWVQLKYFTYQPAVYPRFIGHVSSGARRGELVTVYDKEGQRFGAGFWNPGARVPLRMMSHRTDEFVEGEAPAEPVSAARQEPRSPHIRSTYVRRSRLTTRSTATCGTRALGSQ